MKEKLEREKNLGDAMENLICKNIALQKTKEIRGK